LKFDIKLIYSVECVRSEHM